MGCQTSKYKRNYPPAAVSTSSSALKRKAKEGDCKFFAHARASLNRDYMLLVDRSGSMSGSSWTEAREAVQFFAGSICDFDPTGITLIFFDHEVVKFDNVRDPQFVVDAFARNPPRGSTDLAKALNVAFEEHFSGTRGASTILVITDGSPDSQEDVANVIKKAANSISSDEELSISFVQVGNSSSARAYLRELDDDLKAKFDIVDVIVPSDLKEMSFQDVIRKSLSD